MYFFSEKNKNKSQFSDHLRWHYALFLVREYRKS